MARSLLQMLLVLSTPTPFFLFLQTCFEDAVKKHITSGLLDNTQYHLFATAFGDLPITSLTMRKHFVKFWGKVLTCWRRRSSSSSDHLLQFLLILLKGFMLYSYLNDSHLFTKENPPCHPDKEGHDAKLNSPKSNTAVSNSNIK